MPIVVTRKKLLAFSILVFVACNSLFFTPGKELPNMGDWFGEFSIDKFIHTAIFCLMSFLFLSAAVLFRQKTDIGKVLSIITVGFLLWAVATELIQLYLIEGRTGSVMDALADGAGVVLALFLVKKGLVTTLFKAKIADITAN